MLFVGVILLIAAAICFFVSRSNESRLHAMNAADTYTAQMLAEIHQRITTTLGADALAEPCEVEGVIECDQPLNAPLSGTPCVAYTYTVTREYEERVTRKDAQGKQETRMEQRSETVESDEKCVSFWVRDATGRTLIAPEGAELDMVENANRWEEANRLTSPANTKGYRRIERILPVGIQVYVLGCAVDNNGQPIIGSGPRSKSLKFLISRQSERDLARSAASAARNFRYAAAGCGAVGAVLLVMGLVFG
ncbi:MAG: hypothetical protein KatS3mg057_1344 [Herpetosiphonaceae bacterium]|nr:MAG: hypothetical protein KatS3mg057_1344 [Herpetosiphonaceae bacterium]